MSLKTPKILVVGDLMLDHYVIGSCSRISPEAPVQVIEAQSEENRLGGACNVAHNLASLGAHVELCGVIGEDHNGQKLLSLSQTKKIGTDLVIASSSRPTTQKSRILVSNQQILRIDYEEKKELDKEILERIFSCIANKIETFDALILSDYGKGVLTHAMTQKLIELACKNKIWVLCDPKGSDYSKYKGATLLTPNKKEAFEATGIEIRDHVTLSKALTKLKEECDLRYSIITLSEDGIGLLDQHMEVIPTQAQEVYDVTGAGDTVIASLAYALSCGKSIQDACAFANIVAAIVVAKVGSAVATQEEIKSFQKRQTSSVSSKIITLDQLPNSDNIVFTNGCFDILHKGHVQYLQEAKTLGDLLIVGLNSDSSVRSIKGEDRPINSQDDRAYLLASLECVDYVILFDEPTPYRLIQAISPKILVKGADYQGKEIVGSEFAEEVRLLDFVEGKSTTKIIQKIKGDQNETKN